MVVVVITKLTSFGQAVSGILKYMILLPVQYLSWHYTHALGSYFTLTKTMLWYIGHVFSIGFLLRTLLAPWKRRNEHYAGGGVEKYLEAVVVSALSRVVGFVIKIPIIITGVISWLLAVTLAFGGFLVWLMLPALLIFGLLFGSYLLYV